MAHNDEAGGSGGKQFWELSQEMEEQPHRYDDAAEDTDPDYTTPSGVGDDTTDGAAEDATTDDGGARTDGSQPKRQRKDRRPSMLGTVKEEFTEVNSDGHPTAPPPRGSTTTTSSPSEPGAAASVRRALLPRSTARASPSLVVASSAAPSVVSSPTPLGVV